MVTRRDTSPEQESEPRGSQPSLIGLIREDWVTHGRAWGSPGFHTLVIYRFGRWQMGLPTTLRTLTNLIYKFLSVMARNIYGIELPLKAQVGRRFRIAHQSGIVIFHNAVIGDDCVIRQNVTIGVGKRGRKAPILGNGVEVYAGAALVGGIAVGDGARIGPNAVVMTDVPPGASVFAQPAQTLRLGRNDPTGTPEDG